MGGQLAVPQVLAGPAHPELAAAVARALGVAPLPRSLSRTPDGEVLARVDESARGRPVVVVQPAIGPVGESLLELLLLADACHRAGASSVTAAVPYLGYLRHDRRAGPGEPLGARVVADILAAARLERLFLVDPHAAGVEAAFSCAVEMLTAVPALARAVRQQATLERAVVVAPDVGATGLARRYARALGAPVAIVQKERLGPADVRAEHLVGDVAGRSPVLVDDILSTGATIAAAAQIVLARGARPEIVVAVTHGLFAAPAAERLRSLPLSRVVTGDTVPPPAGLPFAHQVVSTAPLLAEAIRRTSAGEPLADLE